MASANAHFAIKLLLRAQFRKKGYSLADTNWMLAAADPDLIDAAVAGSGQADALAAAEATATTATATGTGIFATIVAALMTYLESPQGEAIISALVTMLIAALGHVFCECGVYVARILTARVQREVEHANPPNVEQLRRHREHRHQAR